MENILHVVCVALLDSDDKVLISQRPKDKIMPGFWEFPGGKVEFSEYPEDALIRELYEELGIDVEKSCLAPFTFSTHSYDNFDILLLLYVCRVWNGEPISKEGQNIKWVNLKDLRNFKMPDADKSLVAMIIDYI